MKRVLAVLLACGFAVGLADEAAAKSKHRIGVGAHYWKTLDQLDDDWEAAGDIDDSGLSYLASYQFTTLPFQLLKLEADLEVFPTGYAGSDSTAYAPQAYVILGTIVYGALGIGVAYEDDWSDPFYVLRVGLDLGILPDFLHLDINANYQAATWEAITDTDEIEQNVGTITFGAVARIVL